MVSPKQQDSTWGNLEGMERTTEAVSAEYALTPRPSPTSPKAILPLPPLVHAIAYAYTVA
jgi:hypothetical protein